MIVTSRFYQLIEVEYDGTYPNTCSGILSIKVDGKTVYTNKYETRSTGGVWFDKEWCEHVDAGELIWEPAGEWSQEIRDAVAEKLSEFMVCCGGCV